MLFSDRVFISERIFGIERLTSKRRGVNSFRLLENSRDRPVYAAPNCFVECLYDEAEMQPTA